MRTYRKYTDEDVVKIAKEVSSLKQLLERLGLVYAGGNYSNMKRILQKLNVNTDHWTGNAWNKGQRTKDWTQYTKAIRLKPHLIEQRGHACERCKGKTWQDQPIPLELEHSNGDRTDNRLENLLLLCCNCHALTKTWRRPKREK